MENVRPKKALGQNFLTDGNILNRIARLVKRRPDLQRDQLEVGQQLLIFGGRDRGQDAVGDCAWLVRVRHVVASLTPVKLPGCDDAVAKHDHS